MSTKKGNDVKKKVKEKDRGEKGTKEGKRRSERNKRNKRGSEREKEEGNYETCIFERGRSSRKSAKR